jgi:hypothetical protein
MAMLALPFGVQEETFSLHLILREVPEFTQISSEFLRILEAREAVILVSLPDLRVVLRIPSALSRII